MELDILTYMKFIYPVLIALLVLEYLNAKHLFHLKETLASFGIAFGASVMATFTKVAALGVFTYIFELTRPLRAEFLGYETIGWAWWAWILCVICDDFSFYWHHRLSHNIRLLWAAHIPHHSAHQFNLTVSIRNGWFVTLYKPIFWLWLPLVGFEPFMIATALIINSVYQYFLHSQLVPSLGWYEKVFNTPYVHVVHHSSNTEYLDRNHGGILLIWDKLFGTYQGIIKGLKPKYGVLHGPGNYNPITANTHEFASIWKDTRKSSKLKDKLMYIFGPPGWSHDGSTLTAKQMQAKMQETSIDPQLSFLNTEDRNEQIAKAS